MHWYYILILHLYSIFLYSQYEEELTALRAKLAETQAMLIEAQHKITEQEKLNSTRDLTHNKLPSEMNGVMSNR